jgi:hypothetical protein
MRSTSRTDRRRLAQDEMQHGIHIDHTGRFRFIVRQRRRYIGKRRTFSGAVKLAEQAGAFARRHDQEPAHNLNIGATP